MPIEAHYSCRQLPSTSRHASRQKKTRRFQQVFLLFVLWWRRGESNPRPKALDRNLYMLIARFILVRRSARAQAPDGPAIYYVGPVPNGEGPDPQSH